MPGRSRGPGACQRAFLSFIAISHAAEVAVDSLGPSDARPKLNLARYLAKLYRPAEAIREFYAAAAIDAEAKHDAAVMCLCVIFGEAQDRLAATPLYGKGASSAGRV